MNLVDLLAAIAALFGFVYLGVGLLRPEDF